MPWAQWKPRIREDWSWCGQRGGGTRGVEEGDGGSGKVRFMPSKETRSWSSDQIFWKAEMTPGSRRASQTNFSWETE